MKENGFAVEILNDYKKANNIDYKCLHRKYLTYKRKNINYELSKI